MRACIASIGIVGAPIWPNASGERCAKITARTAGLGRIYRTITRVRARTAGARTASAGSATTTSACVSAVALWNGNDPILKERLFGLSGPEGNHGEDVKEYYYYLDNTPTHAYMRMLYKYPQTAFPYARLVAENAQRSRTEPEFELDRDRRVRRRSLLRRNRRVREGRPGRHPHAGHGRPTADRKPRASTCLPTLWCRNTWAWQPRSERPLLERRADIAGAAVIGADVPGLGAALAVCAGTRRTALHRKRDQ